MEKFCLFNAIKSKIYIYIHIARSLILIKISKFPKVRKIFDLLSYGSQDSPEITELNKLRVFFCINFAKIIKSN